MSSRIVSQTTSLVCLSLTRIPVTDAHCHPTDLDMADEDYAGVKLGGLGAMATVPEDQDKVRAIGTKRGWRRDGGSEEAGGSSQSGVKVVSCFGKSCLSSVWNMS